MSKPICALGAAYFALILCVTAARAQNSGSATGDARNQSTGPYPALVSWANWTNTTVNPEQLTPDQHPLTGVQGLTLGDYSEPQSFVLPSINVTSQLDTNPPGVGNNGIASVSYLLGRLDLHHVSHRSELLLDYTGGGMLSPYSSNANAAVIQDLEFSYSLKWLRWSLLLGDEASYLSESPFGFGGVGGLKFMGNFFQFGSGGLLGGTLPFLNASVTPNQTISTVIGPRLSNTAVSQVEYQLSPRSSWTASGSYGLLRFVDAGYVNSSDALFQAGYNYQVSPVGSVAVLYRFNNIRFTNVTQRIDDHVVQLAYARRVTGRLSFQIAAGPDLVAFRDPLTGSGNDLSWTADTSLSYQLAKTAAFLSYNHLITAGSGVLVGAETNQVQGALIRNLSRTWRGTVFLGYARNQNLAQTSLNSVRGLFNSWYASVLVSHQLRPGMTFFVAYGANLQGTTTVGCTAPNCGSNSLTHLLSVGFNWGLRPIALR